MKHYNPALSGVMMEVRVSTLWSYATRDYELSIIRDGKILAVFPNDQAEDADRMAYLLNKYGTKV